MVSRSDLIAQDSAGSSARDAMLLIARLLLVLLFVLYGWQKMLGFGGTVNMMSAIHLPLPTISAAIVVILEFFVGLAIAVGLFTRPLAFILALYTLATGFIGHHYWTLSGPEHAANMINFYKNVSIMGGLLLLSVTGAGRYSLEGRKSGPSHLKY
jgi:putative oxidoreductase